MHRGEVRESHEGKCHRGDSEDYSKTSSLRNHSKNEINEMQRTTQETNYLTIFKTRAFADIGLEKIMRVPVGCL